MIERVKSRWISAALVDVDAGIIQQAVDYMAVGKKEIVRLIVVNNICVGIDTANTNTPIPVLVDNPQLLLSHERLPRKPRQPRQAKGPRKKLGRHGRRAARHPDINSIDRTSVLKIFNESQDGSTNAQTIGDRLNAPQKSPLRSKISRVLASLVADRTLTMRGQRALAVYKLTEPVKVQAKQAQAKQAPAKQSQAKQAPAKQAKVQAPTMPRRMAARIVITEATVLAELRKGPEMLSMDISDNLRIDRKDGKTRVKVSTILNALLKRNVIEIVGKSRGIMPIYKLRPEEPDQTQAEA